MNCLSFVASIEGLRLVVEQQNCNDEKLISDVEKITSTLGSEWMKRYFATADGDDDKRYGFDKVVQAAVKVWNTTVAKHAGKFLTDKNNAILRQMCYDLISYGIAQRSLASSDKNEIRRGIMMGIKVGKAWMDVGDHNKSSSVLIDTKKNIDLLTDSISKEGPTDWYLEDKMSLQQDLFAVYCLMSEIAYVHGTQEDSFKHIDKAVNLPILSGYVDNNEGKFQNEWEKLCALTYNFGVRAANEQRFDDAIRWLSKSFEAGKHRKNMRPSVLAKILRLLAHAYSEVRTEDGDKKALNASELADGYVNHPSGLHIRLKVLARNSCITDEHVNEILLELLHHQDLSVELGLSACRHLNANSRIILCDNGMKTLLKKYNGSPHMARIYSQQFEFKTQRLEEDQALEFAESFLNDGEVISAMDRESTKLIHLLMWEQAEKYQEKGDNARTLAWYDLSLKFHSFTCNNMSQSDVNERTENIAKIHRNRTSCLIKLKRFQEAKWASEEASKFSSKSPKTDFSLFKIAVMEGNRSAAIEAIEKLVGHLNASHPCDDNNMQIDNDEFNIKSQSTIHGLVCLAAQLAFENNERIIAMNALRHVSDTTSDRAAKLLAQRCLVRLHLQLMEEKDENNSMNESTENILKKATVNVEKALEILEDVFKQPLNDSEMKSRQQMSISTQNDRNEITKELISDEAEWFMKICWNMALESKSYQILLQKLFHLCHRFLCLLTKDKAILTRQKTCLLMSCAAALEVARNSTKQQEMENHLRFALEKISEHKGICQQLHKIDGITSQRDEKEAVLRSLYEFEASSKLTRRGNMYHEGGGDNASLAELTELERLFENIVSLPQVTVKTFETIAALCVQQPANHVNLSKRALKIAMKKLDSQVDNENDQIQREKAIKFSTFYRNLIDLALQEGSGIDPSSKEEALSYLRDALELVDGRLKKFYPELECLWLTVKSWNIGARLFIGDHIVDADKWCSIAMRFLAHLKHYKSSYEGHMNEVYQEILSKKESLNSRREAQSMDVS